MSEVKKHFDKIAPSYDSYKKRYKYYYDNLKNLLTRLIPSNKVVLEVGCGNGHLLASLNTKLGYGIDISPQMIKIANSKYKEIKKREGREIGGIAESAGLVLVVAPRRTFFKINQRYFHI